MYINYNVLLYCLFAKFALYQASKCGQTIDNRYRIEERIVGGYDVGYYKYPWYAALISYGSVSCGGTLVAPNVILTAAHCFKLHIPWAIKGATDLANIYKVRLGVYNKCVNETTQKTFDVKRVIVHEKYWEKKPYYDLAMLILKGDTSQYRPICLPPANSNLRPREGFVTGLGTLQYKGIFPCTVHEARLLVSSDAECHEMIVDSENDANLIHNSFCAGYIDGGIDACQGDSGGPFHAINEHGDYVLIGVVSFGFHCAMPKMLGMYTDVTKYVDWINKKIAIHSRFIEAQSPTPLTNNSYSNFNVCLMYLLLFLCVIN